VPVLVRTGAKYFLILLYRPTGVVQFVGGIKMFFSANVDHAV